MTVGELRACLAGASDDLEVFVRIKDSLTRVSYLKLSRSRVLSAQTGLEGIAGCPDFIEIEVAIKKTR